MNTFANSSNRILKSLLAVFTISFCLTNHAQETGKAQTDTEPAAVTETQVVATTQAITETQVRFETSAGAFTLTLFDDKAPATVANFLAYVDNGFYQGTLFHRVIPGFMAQGGGMLSGMIQKQTGDPVQNESLNGLQNLRGTIAMARTSHPHSATSQFFINVANNPNLDARGQQFGYAVFGQVTEGMEIVDKIVNSPSGRVGYHQNVPLTEIVIQRATLVNSEMPAATSSTDAQ